MSVEESEAGLVVDSLVVLLSGVDEMSRMEEAGPT